MNGGRLQSVEGTLHLAASGAKEGGGLHTKIARCRCGRRRGGERRRRRFKARRSTLWNREQPRLVWSFEGGWLLSPAYLHRRHATAGGNHGQAGGHDQRAGKPKSRHGGNSKFEGAFGTARLVEGADSSNRDAQEIVRHSRRRTGIFRRFSAPCQIGSGSSCQTEPASWQRESQSESSTGQANSSGKATSHFRTGERGLPLARIIQA